LTPKAILENTFWCQAVIQRNWKHQDKTLEKPVPAEILAKKLYLWFKGITTTKKINDFKIRTARLSQPKGVFRVLQEPLQT